MATQTATRSTPRSGVKESVYEWEGKDRNGKVVRGETRAGGENQVHATLRRQGVIDAFQGMRLYADGHFADEELLMQERGYPELEAHKRLHATFLAMAADLEARLGEGAGLLSVETLEFLGSWFIGHIRNEDQRFAAFARS